jgi:ApbE superfamily uncharacterized protein (UPF0280 family)
MSAERHLLPDGRRRWLHGPIDVVIAAEGEPAAMAEADARAWRRFEGLLDELVAELPVLRAPVDPRRPCPLDGPVARRMWQACAPHAEGIFITPMAAVAGAVAEELLACYRGPGLRRASVNNGGDIALHLTAGTRYRIGWVADLAAVARGDHPAGLDGRFVVEASLPVRGIATSGWRGRSLSLGIADSVTVLAATAAQADAAATVIANAVDLPGHPGIRRAPAERVRDGSDLGALPVTVDVAALSPAEADAALQAGRRVALALQARGRIVAALLGCQGRRVAVSPAPGLGFSGAFLPDTLAASAQDGPPNPPWHDRTPGTGTLRSSATPQPIDACSSSA